MISMSKNLPRSAKSCSKTAFVKEQRQELLPETGAMVQSPEKEDPEPRARQVTGKKVPGKTLPFLIPVKTQGQ